MGMATKKKRNKRYQGADAANRPANVTKVSVPSRSKLGKWYHENRKKWATRLTFLGVILISYALVSWLLGLIF